MQHSASPQMLEPPTTWSVRSGQKLLWFGDPNLDIKKENRWFKGMGQVLSKNCWKNLEKMWHNELQWTPCGARHAWHAWWMIAFRNLKNDPNKMLVAEEYFLAWTVKRDWNHQRTHYCWICMNMSFSLVVQIHVAGWFFCSLHLYYLQLCFFESRSSGFSLFGWLSETRVPYSIHCFVIIFPQ